MTDIQDHFEYIIKKHETATDIPPVGIYINKIENKSKRELSPTFNG